MQTLRIQTLGCSKNRVDSEHLLSRLESIYEISPEGETSPVDFLLLNTCGFIGDAKEESINMILELGERKLKFLEGNKKALIAGMEAARG